jgi:phosphoglycerol transferase MdoB-like AlkP superfamily enzyme
MNARLRSLSKEIFVFFVANIFIFITGLLVIAKVLYFNVAISLLNEKLVVTIVTTVVVFTLLSPALFFKNKIRYSTGFNIFFSLLVLADIVYIRYFNSLPSIQSIFYADAVFGVTDSVKGLLRITDLLLFVDILLLIILYRKYMKKGLGEPKNSNRKLSFAFFLLCLSALIFVVTYDMKNIRLLTTRVFDNRVVAERYSLGGYHLLDIYRFSVSRFDHITEEEKTKVLNEVLEYARPLEKNEKTGLAKNKRVIMVQVESLQDFVINKKIEGQEITPNFNNLIATSDYFSNHYYQMGFGGTADTDLVANASVYPLRNASTFVQYGDSELAGLGDILGSGGYSTQAYHGFLRSFWNRNIALKSLGYQEFYGSEKYEDVPKVLMGAADEGFYQKTAGYIAEQKTPSLSYVISLTSHFPFDIPQEERDLKLDEEYPRTIEDYYQAMRYADKSFGKFIEELKSKGLYDDSVIMVYGDHAANVGDINDSQVYKTIGYTSPLSAEQRIEMKKVPLIIHLPGQKASNIHQEVSSHIDIMPTIMNLTATTSGFPIFGRDLYSKSEPFFASVLYFEQGYIESDKYKYFDAAIEGIQNGRCLEFAAGKWQKTENNNCLGLVKKRDKDLYLSEKLIKYNLFKDIY